MTSATTNAHVDNGPQPAIGQLKKDLSNLLEKQDDSSLWELNHSEIEFTKELGTFFFNLKFQLMREKIQLDFYFESEQNSIKKMIWLC